MRLKWGRILIFLCGVQVVGATDFFEDPKPLFLDYVNERAQR
jgi:hypothetical protein